MTAGFLRSLPCIVRRGSAARPRHPRRGVRSGRGLHEGHDPIARDSRSRHRRLEDAGGGRRPAETLHRDRRGQRSNRRRRQALRDRIRDAASGRMERAVSRSGQRRQRRGGAACDRRPAEGARFRRRAGAGARLCGHVVGQRTFRRRSGQQGARPRRRRGLRPRSAGPARLWLFGRHDARADRQGDHRRPLRPQARLFLHVRLLEWRTPHDGGGDADAGSL